MKERNKINVYSTTATFVIFSLVLAGSIVGMIMFIRLMGENTKYPSKDKTTSTTEVTTTTTTQKVEETTSYVATLKDIIGEEVIEGNYSVSINYENTNYYLKCTTYDSKKETCTSGIGLLQYNNNAIPLYVFSDSEDDYSTNGKDYHIIVDEEYVIFTYNNISEIYTSTGKKHMNIKNVITEYDLKDESGKYTDVYPLLKNKSLEYYICDTNTVIRRTLSIENKNVITDEIETKGVC